MKSFSPTAFASENAAVLERAAALVDHDPQALFSDFQWFLYRARNTVYFTAYSAEPIDRQRAAEIVGEMVALAPQLTHGFIGARPGHPFPQHIVDAIISAREVDGFEGYPDRWIEPALGLYDTPELPLFRVLAITRRGGPDAQGRAAMVMVRASHALMEGSDSALLTRSQHAGHGVMSDHSRKIGSWNRLRNQILAWAAAPFHLVAAHVLAPPTKKMGFATMVLSRRQVGRLARALGVRSRSLLFALVTHAINGHDGAINKRVIAAAYTMLDGRRTNEDDDFFRVRALDAKFPVLADLVEYARSIDRVINTAEGKDVAKTQAMLNAMFGVHRRIAALLPMLYGPRFFRYSGPFDVILTVVPPHRASGGLTGALLDPIWAGSYHPGSNLCTFVPGREFVTLNFSMETKYLGRVARITGLIGELEGRVG